MMKNKIELAGAIRLFLWKRGEILKVSDLPDIDFIDISVENVESIIFSAYTKLTGRTLAQGDPVRLFILFIVNVIIMLLNKINETAKQNLLKYSTGENLENLAAFWDVQRIPAQSALTTLKVELSTVRDQATIIPAGTRVSPTQDLFFATNTELIIPAGETSATVVASCTDTGTVGNDFTIGEISRIVDPISYVAVMTNITKSQGGSAIEDDDSLRERTFEAPEALSTAGPELAYKWHAKSTNSAIIDVGIDSPSPGCVRIVPLLKGGEIPGNEILTAIFDNVSAKKKRPLTDNVSVESPTIINFDLDIEYYLTEDADISITNSRVAAAVENYILWQKSKLGRDSNDSELIACVKSGSGVKRVKVVSPVFTVIEATQLAVCNNISVSMIGREVE